MICIPYKKLNFEIPCKSLHEFYPIKLSLQKRSNLITEVVTVLFMAVAVVVAVVVTVVVVVVGAVVVAISCGLTEVSGI